MIKRTVPFRTHASHAQARTHAPSPATQESRRRGAAAADTRDLLTLENDTEEKVRSGSVTKGRTDQTYGTGDFCMAMKTIHPLHPHTPTPPALVYVNCIALPSLREQTALSPLHTPAHRHGHCRPVTFSHGFILKKEARKIRVLQRMKNKPQ